MNVSEKLQAELGVLAPEWDWFCEEIAEKSPDLISPKTLQVRGRQKNSGAQTLPVHVSANPTAKVHQLARFICDVLMIGGLKPEKSATSLLVAPAS